MKISELDEHQKGHLVWRLDHKTGMGLVTAMYIAKGRRGDLDLVDVFKLAGKSEHSAKIHARKVINFKLTEAQKQELQRIIENYTIDDYRRDHGTQQV